LSSPDNRDLRSAGGRRRTALRVLLILLAVIVVGGAGFAASAWRPAIAPIEPPARTSFDPELVARGSELVALGDCATCHTAPGGKTFGGGLALNTPFGVIYTPNITPDHDTGIGSWSEAAFHRAMREGVSRKGNHLYPALPYDHFTLVTDDDVKAIYAFLMTRTPIHARAPETHLPFPLNYRQLLAGWKLLFFREGPYRPDPSKDDVWNRGAYLVEGLGHCGSCHTPRNFLGAEKASQRYAGGDAEGWNAYAINASSPAPVPWTVESLEHFLDRGFFATHGMARGAMTPVVANLGIVPREDVHAIATYVASLMGTPSATVNARVADLTEAVDTRGNGMLPASAGVQVVPPKIENGSDIGETIYASVCATCHESRRAVPYGGVDLHLSTAMNGPTPQNPINVILFGIPAAEGSPSGTMPGFAGSLTDEQIAALITYLRGRFSDKPAWSGVVELVKKTRSGGTQVVTRSADGVDQAPPLNGRRETTW
jgi:mono/diheme cytochrome c family protein